jgi:hypothetical protein
MTDMRALAAPPTVIVAPCDDARGWCVETRGHVVDRADSRGAAELRAMSRLIQLGGGQLLIRSEPILTLS